MISIDNIDDDRIVDYRNLKQQSIHGARKDRFVVEGRKVVQKLLESKLETLSIFATKEFYSENIDLINSKVNVISQFVASKSMMNEIAGFKLHSGILAVALTPNFCNVGELSDTIVALNKIGDAENLGSIIRNCIAFGVNSIIIDSGTYYPYSRRVARVSMGALFKIKIASYNTLSESLKPLKRNKYNIYAIENNIDSEPVENFNFVGKKILIFGNETNGISREILKVCDSILEIKMNNDIESLNVASASAILLNKIYENRHGDTIRLEYT
ncbi:MAG: RNA methyltransferase [Desulfobulbaceae bacterium]|nr:RNA methyltransferase [Candidatus Kapabacteria bacterium]MBS3999842.1 RNA methyltransferase [Desulfobulbaceae bacterium]